MKSLTFLLSVFLILKGAFGGNILYLNGIPSPSHHHYNRVFILGLAAKGHNVTFVSVDTVKKPTPNVHYIYLEKAYEIYYGGSDGFDILEFAKQSPTSSIMDVGFVYAHACQGVLESQGLDTILNYPEDFKFDAVIYDFTFGPCLLPLMTRFNNPPLISISAFANPPYTTDIIGGQKYPAYIPHYAVNYSTDMNFFQRFYNTYLYFIDWLSREVLLYPKLEKMTRDRFKFDFPPLKELSQKSSLIFINTDNAIDLPEPLQPNMIQIGGLQIVDSKPLPEDMENFVKSGKKGTVLMSLGTNVKSNMLGNDRLKIIIETFAKFPDYNFVWKFESEVNELPIKPTKNVLIANFLPQNDILAHPNLKAFISHAGMLSTHEALWHGKPIIGLPFFVDQHRNLQKLINADVASKVDFTTMSVESFQSEVHKVLSDTKYYSNAQKISKLFKDKPQKPLDTAIWWTEFVMRNPNLDNLKSPTLKMGPFTSKSYDIFLVLIVFLHAVAFVLLKVVKITGKIFRNPDKSKKNSQKKSQ